MDDRPLPRLGELTGALGRAWRLALVLLVLGALAGLVAYQQVPLRYTATAKVALAPQLSYVSLSQVNERQPPVSLDTTAALLRSTVAIDRVSAAMGVTPREVRQSMVIGAEPLSRVLVVSISADTPEQALAGAEEATSTLVALQSQTFALRPAALRLLQNRVATLKREAQERIADGLPSGSLLQVVNILQNRLDKAQATNNAQSIVIDSGRLVVDRPVDRAVFVGSGAAVGLVLGLLLGNLVGDGGRWSRVTWFGRGRRRFRIRRKWGYLPIPGVAHAGAGEDR